MCTHTPLPSTLPSLVSPPPTPSLHSSSVLFSFVEYLLYSPPPHLNLSSWKELIAPSPSPLVLQIIPHLTTSHHPLPSSLPPPTPLHPFPLYSTSLPPTSPHAHTAFIIIFTTSSQSVYSLHPHSLSTSLPPSVTQWHPNSQVLSWFFYIYIPFSPQCWCKWLRPRRCANVPSKNLSIKSVSYSLSMNPVQSLSLTDIIKRVLALWFLA